MNWQDYPHLFAKFEMIDREGDVWDVLDYLWQNSNDVTGCQLIARKIEDMTDEGINYYMGYEYKGSVSSLKEKMILTAKNGTMIRNGFLRLLELGVYPFNQKAFETGEVLDVKEDV